MIYVRECICCNVPDAQQQEYHLRLLTGDDAPMEFYPGVVMDILKDGKRQVYTGTRANLVFSVGRWIENEEHVLLFVSELPTVEGVYNFNADPLMIEELMQSPEVERREKFGIWNPSYHTNLVEHCQRHSINLFSPRGVYIPVASLPPLRKGELRTGRPDPCRVN